MASDTQYSPKVAQYNARDTVVTVNDFYLTGLGEDFVTGERQENFFEPAVGAMGDVVENETNNDLGTITLSLQATSPQLKTMLQYARAGEHFSIWCSNKSIGERFGGTNARIVNYPSLEYGVEIAEREFEITVFDYTVEPI